MVWVVDFPWALAGSVLSLSCLWGFFLGVDPSTLLALLSGNETQQQTETRRADDGGYGSSRMPEANRADPMRQFVSVVLADTEDVWSQLFKSMGRTYDDPKLVLYSDRVSSACGLASAASGPFYCQEDQKAYLDLSFFQEMKGSMPDVGIARLLRQSWSHEAELGPADSVPPGQPECRGAEG